MELQDLFLKLDQIEEQARLTLGEFPRDVGKERQRIIIALVGHVRREVERTGMPSAPYAELPGEALPT